VWTKAKRDFKGKPHSDGSLHSLQSRRSWRERDSARGDELKGRASALVFSPSCTKKVCWDLLSTMVICYDILVCPLAVFDYDRLPSVMWITLGTTVFWTIDLVMSFCCGYHTSEGTVEMRLHKTARRYATTWLALDLVVLLLDWGLFVLGIESEEAVSVARMKRVVRFVRVLKVLRFVRLVRVIKLVHLFHQICEYILSPTLIMFTNILRLLLILSILVHYIACAWVAVGFSSLHANEDSWLSQLVGRSIPSGYLYTISFHWTMAQFLPAPAVEHPKNMYELIFTIFVLWFGFVVFSSTLGSVTALITQARKVAYDQMIENQTMRQFFEQNHVSRSVANRVLHFQALSKKSACITVKDVPIVEKLPTLLRERLMHEVHMQTLSEYPLFVVLDRQWCEVIKKMCVESMHDAVYKKDEEPFQFCRKALCMRFVRTGLLHYVPGKSSADAEARICECGNELYQDSDFCRKCGKKWEVRICICGNEFYEDSAFCRKCGRKREALGNSDMIKAVTGSEEEITIQGLPFLEVLSNTYPSQRFLSPKAKEKPPDREMNAAVPCATKYLSEAVLWTDWLHRGTATARTTTRIIEVSSDSFIALTTSTPGVQRHCAIYAGLFCMQVQSASDCESLDDTFCAFADADSMHQAMCSFRVKE